MIGEITMSRINNQEGAVFDGRIEIGSGEGAKSGQTGGCRSSGRSRVVYSVVDLGKTVAAAYNEQPSQ